MRLVNFRYRSVLDWCAQLPPQKCDLHHNDTCAPPQRRTSTEQGGYYGELRLKTLHEHRHDNTVEYVQPHDISTSRGRIV